MASSLLHFRNSLRQNVLIRWFETEFGDRPLAFAASAAAKLPAGIYRRIEARSANSPAVFGQGYGGGGWSCWGWEFIAATFAPSLAERGRHKQGVPGVGSLVIRPA